MDALTDILRTLHLRATVFFHSSFCGTWAVDTSGSRQAAFHVVAQGMCWLHVGEQRPVELRAGDLLILPRDAPHVISSLADRPGPEIVRNQPGTGHDGPSTSLICGYFGFGSACWNPVIESLPDVMLLQAGREHGSQIETLIRLIVGEAETTQAGFGVVLDRLSDALFILAVRETMQRNPQSGNVLSALADSRLSRSLQVMHARPEHPWQLASLAREAGMSRAAFARHFRERVGMTPLDYLTRWRMQCASEWLLDPLVTMIEIAERAGYKSEAAFSRAFKREFGMGPGRFRRRVSVPAGGAGGE